MDVRGRFLRGGALIGLGQVLSQGFSFARNLVVARLLSVEDMGVAAMLAVTVSLIEMLSDVGVDRLLVQSKDGDCESFQASAQFASLVRGVAGAAILLAVAGPVSALFSTPQAVWAFRGLALVPLLRGALHQDINRMQRQMRFAPATGVEIAAQAVALLAAWPLARWLGNYTAMLWILVGQVLTGTVASHLLAERRFAARYQREHAKRIFAFGWPLLINGLLMFAIFQGDRVVIGAAGRLFSAARYSLGDLGIYSVSYALTLILATLCSKMVTMLLLPLLSSAQNDAERFARRYRLSVELLCVMSLGLAVGTITAGGAVVVTLYGTRYSAAGPVFGWLMAAQCMRLVRVGPAMAALAKGDTVNTLLANVVRVLGVPAALAAAAVGADLVWIARAGLGAEALAIVASAVALRMRHGTAMGDCLKAAGLVGAGITAAMGLRAALESHGTIQSMLAAAVASAVAVGLAVCVLGAVREEGMRVVRGRLLRRGEVALGAG